jgi:hypothetical protein
MSHTRVAPLGVSRNHPKSCWKVVEAAGIELALDLYNLL